MKITEVLNEVCKVKIMKITEVLIEDIVLEEGKRFFKQSKKIDKTIEDLQKKINRLKNKPAYIPLRNLLNKLKKLQIKFEEIENSKESGKVSREKLSKLKSEHKELLHIVSNNEVKRTLQKLGLFFLFGTATMLLGTLLSELTRTTTIEDAEVGKTIQIHPADMLLHKPHEGFEATNVVFKTQEKLTSPQAMVSEICKKEGINFDLIKELINKESEWKSNAIGKNPISKDIGLMQLNSRYIKWFVEKFWTSKKEFDVMNPQDNVTLGVKYFKWLLKLFKNDTEKALMAYNAGPTAVLNDKIPKRSVEYAKSILKALGALKSVEKPLPIKMI